MGLNGPGALWHDNFCERIADAGYYVIRYDNRDVGLSTHFTEFPAPNVLRMALPRSMAYGECVPYTLEDMAADGMNLLTALGINEAHVVGCSMGGMIVQIMATHYPKRVRSLTIIFSHTGSSKRVKESWAARLWFLDKPASSSLEDMVEFKCRIARRLCGPNYVFEEKECKDLARSLLQRAPEDPMGMRRQLAAIQRAKCRAEALKTVKVPTLVIHGMMDQLIPYENGVQIASLIGRPAKLVLYPLMSHSLPDELMPSMTQEIIWNAQRPTTDA
ncbi:hydrolase, alpha/beta fold family [Trypanosoma grayi]|uniref:hydrolase, alpha/beta fold family n=1 Tax=Trypanosoma grayi TaxID=71804 RepID=UPI0004F486A9|nr:hydrolase, alpha/beta fold family [Trypanosoma grayi]KEG11231.1 hydrolase, alpha/beta fold family [Trypanosoma grayi]